MFDINEKDLPNNEIEENEEHQIQFDFEVGVFES